MAAVHSTASRTYGLQVDSSGRGVVNVPWTNTTYTLPAATNTVRGGIELYSNTVQTTAVAAVHNTASRTYGLQVDSNGRGVVNVPWTSGTGLPSFDGADKVLATTNGTSASWASYTSVCFLPGTKITLSNNIKINIEKLKKGDTILSYKLDDMEPYTKSVDVLSWFSEDDTGEFTESEVSNIWSDKSPGYIILNDKLHVTHEHLIFTKMDDEYTWLSAKEIRKGDIIFTDKGEYEEITKIEKIKEEVTVYNLRVISSAMNYFADSYLVHNASLCDECAAKNNKL